ncbi:hypothetical protein MTYP_00921 [Methylophilaceae bacterium]|nr:hypothetical protein MTYP_00921 [Methylophilaceae bacterium]
MSKLLISVMNLHEAQIAMDAGVDIIDMKNPLEGALGALPPDEIARIVRHVDGRVTTSATIGDLPMLPELIIPAVEAVASTGVDIVKIGFYGGGDQERCIACIEPLASRGINLVAVLMADQAPDFNLLPRLRSAGFLGVMLDTAEKAGKHLLDHLDLSALERFVGIAMENRLVTGLAGSLNSEQIETLSGLGPHYMGFRGAVCNSSNRVDSLNRSKLYALREVLRKSNTSSVNKAQP